MTFICFLTSLLDGAFYIILKNFGYTKLYYGFHQNNFCRHMMLDRYKCLYMNGNRSECLYWMIVFLGFSWLKTLYKLHLRDAQV